MVVEAFAQFRITLRLVHVGVSCAVDDEVNVLFRYHGLHLGQVGDVERGGFHAFLLAHIGEKKMVGGGGSEQADFVAQLPVGSRDEYIHLFNRVCR